jgi:hypothetical protein
MRADDGARQRFAVRLRTSTRLGAGWDDLQHSPRVVDRGTTRRLLPGPESHTTRRVQHGLLPCRLRGTVLREDPARICKHAVAADVEQCMNCPTAARPETRMSVLVWRRRTRDFRHPVGKFGRFTAEVRKADRPKRSKCWTARAAGYTLDARLAFCTSKPCFFLRRTNRGRRNAALVAVVVRMVTGDGDRRVAVGCRRL